MTDEPETKAELEQQNYIEPAKLAQFRRDLAELRAQIRQFESEEWR